MKPVKGVNLKVLVEECAEELVELRRKQAANIIKQLLQRMEQLSIDVRNLEKELRNKQEKLVKAKAKIDKIKEGQWDLLAPQTFLSTDKKKKPSPEKEPYNRDDHQLDGLEEDDSFETQW